MAFYANRIVGDFVFPTGSSEDDGKALSFGRQRSCPSSAASAMSAGGNIKALSLSRQRSNLSTAGMRHAGGGSGALSFGRQRSCSSSTMDGKIAEGGNGAPSFGRQRSRSSFTAIKEDVSNDDELALFWTEVQPPWRRDQGPECLRSTNERTQDNSLTLAQTDSQALTQIDSQIATQLDSQIATQLDLRSNAYIDNSSNTQVDMEINLDIDIMNEQAAMAAQADEYIELEIRLTSVAELEMKKRIESALGEPTIEFAHVPKQHTECADRRNSQARSRSPRSQKEPPAKRQAQFIPIHKVEKLGKDGQYLSGVYGIWLPMKFLAPRPQDTMPKRRVYDDAVMDSIHGPKAASRRPWLDEYDPSMKGYPFQHQAGKAVCGLYDTSVIFDKLNEQHDDMYHIDLFFQKKFYTADEHHLDEFDSPDNLRQRWGRFLENYNKSPEKYVKQTKKAQLRFLDTSSTRTLASLVEIGVREVVYRQ